MTTESRSNQTIRNPDSTKVRQNRQHSRQTYWVPKHSTEKWFNKKRENVPSTNNNNSQVDQVDQVYQPPKFTKNTAPYNYENFRRNRNRNTNTNANANANTNANTRFIRKKRKPISRDDKVNKVNSDLEKDMDTLLNNDNFPELVPSSKLISNQMPQPLNNWVQLFKNIESTEEEGKSGITCEEPKKTCKTETDQILVPIPKVAPRPFEKTKLQLSNGKIDQDLGEYHEDGFDEGDYYYESQSNDNEEYDNEENY